MAATPSGQLIPDWRHPSETTFIFDNTVVQDTESMNVESVTLLTIFTSPKGIDNKLLKKESLYAHVEEYGYPDYKRFGQAGYIPYTALSTGNATCWEMRIMPENATYGNVFYVIKYRTANNEVEKTYYKEIEDGIMENTGYPDETLDATTKKRKVAITDPDEIAQYKLDHPEEVEQKQVLQIMLEPYSVNNLNDSSRFEEYMRMVDTDNLTDEAVDGGNNWNVCSYIGFRMLGRGDYGKYYRIRMAQDISSDRSNDYVNYVLNTINTEYGIIVKETFPQLTFVEDGTDPQTNVTNYITEVINDYEGDGSQRIAVVFLPEAHERLYNFYVNSVDPDTDLTLETFDILFGRNKLTGDYLDNIQLVAPNEANNGYEIITKSSVALFSDVGVKLNAGSDGAFADNPILTDTNYSSKEEAIKMAYLAAFSGEKDPKINSKLRAPCNICLDANFDDEVKKALNALVQSRKDMIGYLDFGLKNTITQIKDYANGFMKDIEHWTISKNCGMFTTRDSVTGKRIPVTPTMWLAYRIPMHWRQNGLHVPLAGEAYGTFSGYIRNSIKPEIDADDHETKEWLYDARINYIECLSEDTFIRGTQQTSQLELSDLSEENNVHVLLQVKRRLERLCAQKRYRFGEAADRKLYTDDANELFSSWKGIYLRDIQIEFSMNRYEELRSIIHCTCSIVFNTLIKRSVIEININPRA